MEYVYVFQYWNLPFINGVTLVGVKSKNQTWTNKFCKWFWPSNLKHSAGRPAGWSTFFGVGVVLLLKKKNKQRWYWKLYVLKFLKTAIKFFDLDAPRTSEGSAIQFFNPRNDLKNFLGVAPQCTGSVRIRPEQKSEKKRKNALFVKRWKWTE